MNGSWRGAPWHSGGMQSVYEAAGGREGLLRLAGAWHSRVMADEIVSHAFSHGFHPHPARLKSLPPGMQSGCDWLLDG